MDNKVTKFNQSVEKTMRLVEIMAEHNEPMRLQNISLEANIPASTTLRMIGTLQKMGYVIQDPDSLKYSLSLKFAYLGEQVKRQVNITQVSHPYLIELSNKVGECCCLAIKEGSQILYMDVCSSQLNNILNTTQRIGKSAPMYCTGIGKLLLTNLSAGELANYTNSNKLLPYTHNTITSLGDLTIELQKVLIQGYAVDNEECDQGAKCVAVPIRDYSGIIVAGISITAPAVRLGEERIIEILPLLKETSDSISKALGYNE